MTIDPEELVPASEVARVLRQKLATLTTWRHEKRGPAYLKVGRKVFYRRSDIMLWLGAQRREPGTAA
jgi:hypothetical protein